MLLKVGQLAKQICLSVRTLHHYDEIGLLSPSVRSPAGHRLYNTQDIQQLYRIQVLKQLGLSLQQIASITQENADSLPAVVAQQITRLDHEIEQAVQLKGRLQQLQHQFAQRNDTETSDWLSAMALMNIYQRYLTDEEIATLNQYAQIAKQELEQDWPAMVKQLQTMIDSRVPVFSEDAKTFVIRWTEMLERLVGHNPALLLKVHAMSQQDIELQIYRNITPAMISYLGDAMGAVHREIYARYLSPEQLDSFDQRRSQNREAWPPLIAAVREHMQAGVPPNSDRLRPLAQTWKTLFEATVTGGDPAVAERLSDAYAREPLLMQGTGLDQSLLRFIRAAMDAL